LEFRLADSEGISMDEAEIMRFLEQPRIMRIGVIDNRDKYPMVHPVWYYYEDGKFFVATDKGGQKAESLRRNPALYFLVDSDPAEGPPLGVRGKARATVVDDAEYATRVTVRNIVRYLGSLEGKTAHKIKETGKDSCVLEITPLYIASWKF
jgi:hypothetical protein